MSLGRKVKTALDENRLLVLGAQVLFALQLSGVFQEGFSDLSRASKLLDCAGQILMVLSLGLLIAPSMQHRLVEKGEDTKRILEVTNWFSAAALVPFGTSIGIGIYIVFDHLYGAIYAILAGATFCLLAFVCWFLFELVLPVRIRSEPSAMQETSTPLSTKIEQLLTEARLIIPGAQALLGFQFTVTLTRTFERLSAETRSLHVIALCLVALATILLMTPAALHRISFKGEDDEAFLRIATWLVLAAPLPLGLGIAGEVYVATSTASGSSSLAAILALVAFGSLAALWYALPLALRSHGRSENG